MKYITLKELMDMLQEGIKENGDDFPVLIYAEGRNENIISPLANFGLARVKLEGYNEEKIFVFSNNPESLFPKTEIEMSSTVSISFNEKDEEEEE